MVVIPGGGCATVAIADATALCRCLVLQPGLTERRWLCPNSFVNLPPHEGDAIAEWLAAHGVTAFLLRYRLISSGYSIPTQLADTRERQCRYSLSAKCATGSQRLHVAMRFSRCVQTSRVLWVCLQGGRFSL